MRHLFAEMLSLPNDRRYPALELTPQQRRQEAFSMAMTGLRSKVLRQLDLIVGERTNLLADDADCAS